MGKKRRMMAKPQKFGAKFANHPRMVDQSNQQVVEEITPVVEEVETPVLDIVEEEISPKPKAKPKAKVSSFFIPLKNKAANPNPIKLKPTRLALCGISPCENRATC